MGPNQFHPECGKHIDKEKKKKGKLYLKKFLATPHVGF